MLDNRIVTPPCAGASVRRGSLLRTFTASIPLKTPTSSAARKDIPRRLILPPGRALLLGADRLGLFFRRQLGRQVDLPREILAALDRMGRAGHGIFEDGALECFLCRWRAASGGCDRPLYG